MSESKKDREPSDIERWYGEVDVRARDDDERTPLHGAASDGATKAVGILIGRGAEVDARDKYGATPLHLAAKNGCLAVAALLVTKGASLTKTDNSGQTPIDSARSNRHWRLAQLFTKTQERESSHSGSARRGGYWERH